MMTELVPFLVLSFMCGLGLGLVYRIIRIGGEK